MELSNEKSHCVLIVDDDQHIRTSLETYLRRQGMETLIAEDGFQGLDVLRRNHVDIIITDIMMPKMNGIKFIREVKKDFPDQQIIVITGYGDMNVAIDAMKLGAADFITKPFQFEYLEGIIKDILSKKSATAKPLLGDMSDLHTHLKNKLEEISILYAIADSLEHLNEADEIFQALCDISLITCSAGSASYYISSRSANSKMILHKTSPREKRTIRPGIIVIPDEIQHELFEAEQPILISDPKELQFFTDSSDNNAIGPKSAVLAPFFVRKEFFGVLLLTEDKKERFTEKDVTYTKLLLRKAGVSIENKALYETIYNNLIATLRSLVITIEAKDPYTRHHSARVTKLAVLIGKEMSCSSEQIETLQFAGMLHDIGKIGVSDAILLKKGSLSDEEFEAIKQHPEIGAKILDPLGMLPREKAIIRHHHERWDGRGYPDGLIGKDIPLLVRILTLADSYDAMTSDRVYRTAMSHEIASGEISRNSGTQFDGNIAKAFSSLSRRMKDDLIKYLKEDSGVEEAS
jgi:putative nucleotidyltransferase with HDIG domain